MTFCSLERVTANFGFVVLLWIVVGHKHLVAVVILNCIYTPFSADYYNLHYQSFFQPAFL